MWLQVEKTGGNLYLDMESATESEVSGIRGGPATPVASLVGGLEAPPLVIKSPAGSEVLEHVSEGVTAWDSVAAKLHVHKVTHLQSLRAT